MTLHLTDDAYWDDPTSTLDVVFEQLSAQQLNGVLIGAPATVAFETRRTLPIVAYRCGSYADMRVLKFSSHAILVAVDLDRNIVHFGDAIETPNMSVAPLDNSRPVPEGYTAAPYVIDARERLALPWNPGTYLFSVIMRDRISNRVKVRLGKSIGYRDEAVERFIAEYRRKKPPPSIDPPPGHPLPNYGRLPDSPAIPMEPGIAIKLERVLVLNTDTRWILHGAFRLPVFPYEILAWPSENEQLTLTIEPAPTAVTRITLLGVGADYGRWSLELRVPSYHRVDAATDKPVVTGYFALDLMKAAHRLAPQPQTYFIYALAGDTLGGPVPSALVSEYSLQPER